VGYPLSFGPACWVVSRAGIYDNRLSTIYRPVVSCLSHKPGPCGSLIEQYAGLVAADGWRWGDVGDGQWVYADFAPIAPF